LATIGCPSDKKPPTIDRASEAIRPAATTSSKGVNGSYNNGYSTPTNADGVAFNGMFEGDSRSIYGLQSLTDIQRESNVGRADRSREWSGPSRWIRNPFLTRS
jgi:hypothetical protein